MTVDEIGTGDDTVVVQPRPGIEVYQNQHGMIVVRNFADPYRDDDDLNFTVMHPDDARTVAEAILRVAENIKDQRSSR